MFSLTPRAAAVVAALACAAGALAAPDDPNASLHTHRISQYVLDFSELTFGDSKIDYDPTWTIQGDFFGETRFEDFDCQTAWYDWRFRDSGGVRLNAPTPVNNRSNMTVNFDRDPNNLQGTYGVGYTTDYANQRDGSSWIVRSHDGEFWLLNFQGGGFGLDATATFDISVEVPGRWILDHDGVGGVFYNMNPAFQVIDEWVYDQQDNVTRFFATLPNSQSRTPDLNFTLIGLPTPGAAGLFALAGLAIARRRR